MNLPMIPTPNVYFKIIIAGAFILLSFAGGYYVEHLRFMEYKKTVIAEAKIQEQHNKDLLKEREIENEKIQSDYSSQLASIKRMYNPSGSKLSSPSSTLVSINGYTTDPVFAELCANTTAQLNSLQQWVQAQVGIQ